MLGKDNYKLMADYNQWMNLKLYDVCGQLPDARRKEDLGAFFKSIHATLNHLLFGDLAWMGRFTNTPIPYRIGDEICSDFDELRRVREIKDREIIEWVDTLSDEWLQSPFRWQSGVDGKIREMPSWILVTHMFNHQTHHRGQLTTLIKQLGVEPGITDIPFMSSLNAVIS